MPFLSMPKEHKGILFSVQTTRFPSTKPQTSKPPQQGVNNWHKVEKIVKISLYLQRPVP